MMVAEEVPADYLFIGEAIVPPANWASFPPHRHDFDDLPYEVDMEEIYFFHPYLLGERSPYWDANLRGSFVGATMLHGKPHFVRALLEGVAYSLRDCYRSIVEMQLPVDEIRLIGGGAKSDLWTQIIGDVFARPIVRPAGCDASFGAALLAGVGVGLFADTVAAAEQCIRIHDVVQPQPAAVRVYTKLFPLYCRIHDDLAGAYAALTKSLNELHASPETSHA